MPGCPTLRRTAFTTEMRFISFATRTIRHPSPQLIAASNTVLYHKPEEPFHWCKAFDQEGAAGVAVPRPAREMSTLWHKPPLVPTWNTKSRHCRK